MEISVIIPSYRRHDLLLECIHSCIRNTRKPSEIIIGDDSDESAEYLIKENFGDTPFPIIYIHNRPGLGQADNVDNLIQCASGTHICLIHDDDYLTDTALEALARPFQEYGDDLLMSFGRQLLVRSDGSIDHEGSDELNTACRRTVANAGLQPSIGKAATLQQIPNNGFLIEAGAAKAVGYKQAGLLFKDACDFGFAHLLAKRFPEKKTYFDAAFTAAYRLSDVSIARGKANNNAAFYAFHHVVIDSPNPTDPDLQKWIRGKARAALSYAIKNGRVDVIARWMSLSPFLRRALLAALVRR